MLREGVSPSRLGELFEASGDQLLHEMLTLTTC
jgi:hypothetical protein